MFSSLIRFSLHVGEIEDYEVWYKMKETDLLMFSSKAGSFCTHFTSRILLICYQTSYFAPYTYVPIQKVDPRCWLSSNKLFIDGDWALGNLCKLISHFYFNSFYKSKILIFWLNQNIKVVKLIIQGKNPTK